jgi:hypothetical protein
MKSEEDLSGKISMEGWTFDGFRDLMEWCIESQESKLKRAKQIWFEKKGVGLVEELRNSTKDLVLLAFEGSAEARDILFYLLDNAMIVPLPGVGRIPAVDDTISA